jgi:hypothetical protein
VIWLSDQPVKRRTGLLRRPVEKVREINKKYSTPRIHMSKAVKFSLIVLRIYLIAMVLILLYKFVTLLK